MDPLLKEFLLFFAFWPMVILATIVVGMRLGRWMNGATSMTDRLKHTQPVATDLAKNAPTSSVVR